MTRDIAVLRAWLTVLMGISAVGVNAVPMIYFFSPWRSTRLGRIFMFQAASFAFAIDVSLLFQMWRPLDILVIFWSGVVLYTLIASSTSALAWWIWRLNRPSRKKVEIVKFTSPVYDVLKRVAQIYLPALGTLYFTLAQIWLLPYPEEVSGTILALDTFLGVLLGISSNTYDKTEKYGGTLAIEDHEDHSSLHLKDVDPVILTTRPDITFKIIRQ